MVCQGLADFCFRLMSQKKAQHCDVVQLACRTVRRRSCPVKPRAHTASTTWQLGRTKPRIIGELRSEIAASALIKDARRFATVDHDDKGLSTPLTGDLCMTGSLTGIAILDNRSSLLSVTPLDAGISMRTFHSLATYPRNTQDTAAP